ncbi:MULTISPECIES: TRAP transporter large permease [unclassified Guyparkeria]|uniref:TRAP transporter large permease n=1 Tax=unclassified Guyparkeria TaxID=2626246 RepID=UPI000733662B|nr:MULTISPECIES: TRAP transporter large permease [unclassified Guyparkeria]KTG17142.1 C4-dicarboxylate ABC transporter permease [Guyparkeria sp. XI15]OAE86677.1 C4-dicarboxylate ABC transporter permease [Guyparkeria sp. WRN-7]
MLTVMFVLMFLLLLMGFPMMVPLIVGALALLLVSFPGVDPTQIVQQMIGGVRPSVLVAVPMFILAADIMTKGHTADRLLDLVRAFIGHRRGGLPITTAVTCTLFGAVSGSTQATVVAIGSALRPKMLKAGYKDSFTLALLVNSSDIALLIPPSIAAIIYGVAANVSVGELFIAGIGPGVVIMLMFSLYSWFVARRWGIEPEERVGWMGRLRAFRGAVLPMGFPVVVLGGIYSGLFSPTEAAAMSVFYALILEMVIYRSIKISDLPGIALSTGLITAVVFILVGAGQAFSWVISLAQIPSEVLGPILDQVSANPTMLLVLIAVSYFVACMFVDPIVAIFVLTPIFMPAIQASGVDPVLVGTLVVLQSAIGSATPPFGYDIFTAMAVFRRPYMDIVRGTPPFIIMLITMTVLLISFPQIALFLRDLAFR